MVLDSLDLDRKSFLAVRLDYRRCFFTMGWMTATAVEVLVGVRRFYIKIYGKTSLIIDDSCVTERHGLPGPLGGELDGRVKQV